MANKKIHKPITFSIDLERFDYYNQLRLFNFESYIIKHKRTKEKYNKVESM